MPVVQYLAPLSPNCPRRGTGVNGASRLLAGLQVAALKTQNADWRSGSRGWSG